MKSGVDGRRTCSKQRSITVIEEYFGTRFPVCCFPRLGYLVGVGASFVSPDQILSNYFHTFLKPQKGHGGIQARAVRELVKIIMSFLAQAILAQAILAQVFILAQVIWS